MRLGSATLSPGCILCFLLLVTAAFLRHQSRPRPCAGWLRKEVAVVASELQGASAGFSSTLPGVEKEVRNSHQEKTPLKYDAWKKAPQLPPALSACKSLAS